MEGERKDVPPDYNQATGFQPPPAGVYPPTSSGYDQPQGGYLAGAHPPTSGGYQPPPGSYPPGAYPSQPGMGYMGYNQQQTMVVTGQPVPTIVVAREPRPPDYTLSSILVCLCCFWPTGIFAIYYSMRMNTLADQGDMTGARSASNAARSLMIVSLVIGILWIVAVIIMAATGVFVRNRYYSYSY